MEKMNESEYLIGVCKQFSGEKIQEYNNLNVELSILKLNNAFPLQLIECYTQLIEKCIENKLALIKFIDVRKEANLESPKAKYNKAIFDIRLCWNIAVKMELKTLLDLEEIIEPSNMKVYDIKRLLNETKNAWRKVKETLCKREIKLLFNTEEKKNKLKNNFKIANEKELLFDIKHSLWEKLIQTDTLFIPFSLIKEILNRGKNNERLVLNTAIQPISLGTTTWSLLQNNQTLFKAVKTSIDFWNTNW